MLQRFPVIFCILFCRTFYVLSKQYQKKKITKKHETTAARMSEDENKNCSAVIPQTQSYNHATSPTLSR